MNQGELMPVPDRPRGALEAAARRSVQAAGLDDRDEAGTELVVYLAAQLDRAGNAPKQYVIAGIAQQLRETLAEYGLSPTARGGASSGDTFAELLAELADPSMGNPPNR